MQDLDMSNNWVEPLDEAFDHDQLIRDGWEFIRAEESLNGGELWFDPKGKRYRLILLADGMGQMEEAPYVN